MNIDNVYIVLVEPQGPLNIGSVCRAMMNFGFSKLRLVNPCTEYKSGDAKRMALKAVKYIYEAEKFTTLEEALADCHYSFGTTRRFGKYRDDFLLPESAAKQAVSMPDDVNIALVFGREDCGLHTSELDLCQHFITIPTSDEYPSMNLAQAVSLCMYEIRKIVASDVISEIEGLVPAKGSEVEQMFQHMRKTLIDIDFLVESNPDHILRSFRRIFGRAGLNERDVKILHGLFGRIDWVEGERRKHLPDEDTSYE